MRRLRRALVVAVGVVLAAQPVVARADVVRTRDAVGDLFRSAIDSNVYVAAPRHVEGDIVAIRVAHTRHAVWIRVRLRELTTTSNGNFTLIAIRSDRKFRWIQIDAFPGHWEGQLTVTNKYGHAVTCVVRHRIDYDRSRVFVHVPRRCLGRPDWVRVGARTTVAGSSYAYADDAKRTGLVGGLAVGLGPRVRR